MNKYDADKDYYALLGVHEDASVEEIERAYKNQAKRRHPDFGGSVEDMISLNEANDVLTDFETRKAYDHDRQPGQTPYASSMVFDHDAASKSGALGIPVGGEDLAGLMLGAVTCFGVGLPLLLLVEMQWVFFLWPLRVIALGVLGLGVLLSHSVLGARRRKAGASSPAVRVRHLIVEETVFWTVALGGLGLLMLALYGR
jgi:DnaJ domain